MSLRIETNGIKIARIKIGAKVIDVEMNRANLEWNKKEKKKRKIENKRASNAIRNIFPQIRPPYLQIIEYFFSNCD